MKAAILDDYLGCAFEYADWNGVRDRVEATRFVDPIPVASLAETLADFDILCLMRDRTPITADLLAAMPKLKFVSYTGPSNQTLDESVTQLGITVSNTASPGGLEEHFEFIWALLLATVRNIPGNDAEMRAGKWQSGVGRSLYGQTLGVIGLGNFGSMVARMGRQFGMDVLAWSHNLTAHTAAACGARLTSFEELLERSDVVTVHLRLSGRTEGLIGARELARFKKGAILINTSRGGLVDEGALIGTLESGKLARAGLDVFDLEPLPAAHPFRSMPNVVLSPHMGFSTEALLRSYHQQTLENVLAWLEGRPIRLADAATIAGRAPQATHQNGLGKPG